MIKSMNIAWWVQRWSELHPHKPAVLFEGEEITYLQLHQRANRTGCWLQSLGIEKGDRVAVMLDNCPEYFELYLACSRLGAIFVPVNFRLAPPELDFTLRNCRPRLFVFGSHFAETVFALNLNQRRPLMELACLGKQSRSSDVFDYHRGVLDFDGQKPFLTKSLGPADPEEPQVIMYTSGTTGQPKGAVLSHRKTFFNCLNADIFFKLHFDDIMLIALPLFHSGGLFIQASPIMYKGATIVLHPKFEPSQTYKDIQKYRVTKFLGVPTVYRTLLKVTPPDRGSLSSLRVCAIGGEKTTPDLLLQCKEAGFSLRQIMGQTETSILLWASEEESLRKPGTVGRPVFHAEVGIVTRDGTTAKPGEVGEIVVRGSIMMKEYWQDPVRTEETIKALALKLGKEPVVCVDSSYGFLANRVYAPMRMEAVQMVWERVASPEDIDKAVKLGYNLPVGPLELSDRIGSWGIQAASEDERLRELGEKGRIHPLVRMMIRAGYMGGAGKKGIYDFWKDVLSKH